MCGGRNDAERRAALRQYTEQPVRQGAVECPWERLVAGLVLGTEAFARSLKQGLRVKEREQRQARNLARPVAWEEIARALERARGEQWAEFRGRLGDWGREAALWFGRRQGQLPLAHLGELAGERDYAAVSVALRRFGERLARDRNLRRQVEEIEPMLANVES